MHWISILTCLLTVNKSDAQTIGCEHKNGIPWVHLSFKCSSKDQENINSN